MKFKEQKKILTKPSYWLNKLSFINRTQENVSFIGPSFNYYYINICVINIHYINIPFCSFFSHVYHHRSSILSICCIITFMICYRYSHLPKSTCNFACLVIKLLLVWWRGRRSYALLYQKTNQKIYTFFRQIKTKIFLAVHAEYLTEPVLS